MILKCQGTDDNCYDYEDGGHAMYPVSRIMTGDWNMVSKNKFNNFD